MDFLKLIVVLLIAIPVLGQDQQAACDNLKHVAQAQATILETPAATTGITQSPIMQSPVQGFSSITSSMQGIRKAHALKREADTACYAYKANEDASVKIQYFPAIIEKDALKHREQLDQIALIRYDALIADAQRRVGAQNLTTPALYALESSRNRTAIDLAQVITSEGSLYVPGDISTRTLSELATSNAIWQSLDQARQADILKVTDFDLQTEIGVHKPLLAIGNPQPYGGFTFTYNLGSRKANRLADQAANDYVKWKESQIGGIQQSVGALWETLQNLEHAQHVRLAALRAQEAAIEKNLQQIDGVDTTMALVFKIQLEADEIALLVELKDAEYRFSVLRQALDEQYQ